MQKRQLALRKAISLTLPGKSLGNVLPDKRHLEVFSQIFNAGFGWINKETNKTARMKTTFILFFLILESSIVIMRKTDTGKCCFYMNNYKLDYVIVFGLTCFDRWTFLKVVCYFFFIISFKLIKTVQSQVNKSFIFWVNG